MLAQNATRNVVEQYRRRRTEERRLFRRKKREKERQLREEIEQCRNRNDTRKFFQNVKRQTEGFKPRVSFCRDPDGNLVTDTNEVLQVWKNHFFGLLTGHDSNNPASGEVFHIPEDGVEEPPPSYDEVKPAIQRLKNHKAPGPDGLLAELFKAGGDELIKYMHKLVNQVWQDEHIPIN